MRSPQLRWRRVMIAATLIAIVAGCGTQHPVAPAGPEANAYANPIFARVPAPPRGLSQTMAEGPLEGSGSVNGAVGGEVTVGRFRVIVPPGAFQGMATITVKVPDQALISCELEITPPEANGFSVPVSLVADCQGVSNVDLADCGTLWFDPSANVWRTVAGTEIDLDQSTVTASLQHFSCYGIADLLGRAGW